MLSRAEFLRRGVAGAGLAALAAFGLTGCAPGGTRELDLPTRRILVPAAVGGGYDITARTAAKVLAGEGITSGQPDVFNVPGAGGVVGLARAVAESGHGHLALVAGLGIVGAGWVSGRSDEVAALTPIARVTEEAGAVLVGPASAYDTVEQALSAWRADPTALRVGAGSSRGGPDHLFALRVAREAGIRRDDIVFSAYSGGGELLSALLTDRIDLAFGGAGETRPQVVAGAVRALAVASDAPVPGIDAPTLREAGIDLVFRNWRGFAAPPSIPPSDRERWSDDIARMRGAAAWREALDANGWSDAYLPGDAFGELIREQLTDVGDILTSS